MSGEEHGANISKFTFPGEEIELLRVLMEVNGMFCTMKAMPFASRILPEF